jgi:DNA-binding NtrC family response regulator
MRRIAELIRRLANTDNVVLITGETGTGKELVAKALHELHSKRKQHSIVVVDCARLSIGTAQSELFGHVKGAFTGAVTSTRGLIGRADRGTLFLDEVSCLPLEAQAILLRLLEERDYRPRWCYVWRRRRTSLQVVPDPRCRHPSFDGRRG